MYSIIHDAAVGTWAVTHTILTSVIVWEDRSEHSYFFHHGKFFKYAFVIKA